MSKEKKRFRREDVLHVGRAVIAIFALLVAASHLAYTMQSSGASSTSFPSHSGNQTGSQAPTAHAGPAPAAFNELGFWFDVEVIAYTLIAVVFLLGLRTWYLPSLLFNAFNLGIYIVSGFVAIPGITAFAFGSRFHSLLSLSTINIMVISWIVLLILGFVFLKYDPGSGLDKLLATRKDR